jgi:hypothetical protein
MMENNNLTPFDWLTYGLAKAAKTRYANAVLRVELFSAQEDQYTLFEHISAQKELSEALEEIKGAYAQMHTAYRVLGLLIETN